MYMYMLFLCIVGIEVVYSCLSSILLALSKLWSTLPVQGFGWKVVASFEGNFPNRIKQLPLDRHFDINNVKRVCVSIYYGIHSM